MDLSRSCDPCRNLNLPCHPGSLIFTSGHRCAARGLSKISFSDKVWAKAWAKVPGASLHSSTRLRSSRHLPPAMESAPAPPTRAGNLCFRFALSSFCYKVGMSEGFLRLHQLLPLPPPTRSSVPPRAVPGATSITDTGLSARPRAPLKGPNPEWIYPRGSLVMLLCLQFIRCSVSGINQGWTLFSHTREWGRHAGNR